MTTTTTNHVRPTLGLPYARPEFDERGRYHVVCPVCGFKAYAEGSAFDNPEDNVTKGATLVYGLHFEAEAEAGR